MAEQYTASTIAWFRTHLAGGVSSAIRTQSEIGNDVELFRPWLVFDATLNKDDVPVAQQRLISWQNRPADTVFLEGLTPKMSPADNTYPAGQFDLKTYVNHNDISESIFISTTEPKRDGATLKIWEPRVRRTFQYDIFAFRGMDVNEVLGDAVNPDFRSQREVAFPGGVRPEMIRCARQYTGGNENRKIIGIWMNTNFNITVIPIAHRPALASLPNTNFKSDAPRTYYPGPGELLHDMPLTNLEFEDSVVLGEDGEWVEDEFYNDLPVPLTGITGVLHPSNPNETWFFCGNRFALTKDFELNDKLLQETAIVNSWRSLWEARFPCNVDAILPNPNNKHEMYFFSGNQYAYINTGSINLGVDRGDRIIEGPIKIVDGWASLKKAQFSAINAVFENPINKEEVWFFSGEQYVLVSWRPGQNNDILITGPKPIVDGWTSMRRAKFKTVDALIPNPANLQEAWVFSGEQYALINMTADTMNSEPKPIVDNWPSLHEAGFY